MKKRVLVTGASGNIGFNVVKELLERKKKYTTRILVLGTKNERKMFRSIEDKLEIVIGDIRDKTIVQEAVEDVDFIIHLAAIIPPLADRLPSLAYEVNVIGTENILKKMSERTKLLYSSSISVYGDRVDSPWIKASDPLNPSVGDEYAKTKIKAEKIIKETVRQWAIFRLSAISNPNYTFDPIIFHIPLNTKIEFCLAEDTALAFVKALEFDEIYGKIFNLGGGPACRTSYRDFLNRVLKIFGISTEVIDEKLFAQRNFHCGYYVDGDVLEDLLHFQRGSIEDYYRQIEDHLSPFKKMFYRTIPTIFVRKYFEKMSEPFKARKQHNSELYERYFGN